MDRCSRSVRLLGRLRRAWSQDGPFGPLVERHRAVEAERVVRRSIEQEQPHPVTRPPARQGARTMLVEIAGYVGSALVLASVGLLLAQLWDDFFSAAPSLLGGGSMAVLAAVGYRYAHSALGMVAIAGAVLQVCVTAVEDGSALTSGIIFLAVAAAWLALTELTGFLREHSVARSLGVTLALAGAQVVLFGGGHDNLGYALTAGVAAAGFVLYLRTAAGLRMRQEVAEQVSETVPGG
jgi:hypothetical protein